MYLGMAVGVAPSSLVTISGIYGIDKFVKVTLRRHAWFDFSKLRSSLDHMFTILKKDMAPILTECSNETAPMGSDR